MNLLSAFVAAAPARLSTAYGVSVAGPHTAGLTLLVLAAVLLWRRQL
ncbi:hypothetical protein ACIP93_25345 [Streptomyces sp. NPDC088745]